MESTKTVAAKMLDIHEKHWYGVSDPFSSDITTYILYI